MDAPVCWDLFTYENNGDKISTKGHTFFYGNGITANFCGSNKNVSTWIALKCIKCMPSTSIVCMHFYSFRIPLFPPDHCLSLLSGNIYDKKIDLTVHYAKITHTAYNILFHCCQGLQLSNLLTHASRIFYYSSPLLVFSPLTVTLFLWDGILFICNFLKFWSPIYSLPEDVRINLFVKHELGYWISLKIISPITL